MIKKLLTLGMLLSILHISAQESKRISGKVIDALTGEPLAFSHVGIFNSSYGTISNIDGDFSLIVPTKFNNNKLSASYLGYELKSIPVSSIDVSNDLIIKLKSTVTELPELVIRTNEKSIIEEAIEAIPKNHDQNEMLLRAFWRASIQNDEREYIQLTEYAFDMFRYGELGDENNAMKILKGRVARDTSFFSDIGGMQIGVTPQSLFANSLLKEHAILNKKVLKKHTYKITDATSYNERSVFVVSFKPKKKAKGDLFEGKILLDTESLAFVRIAFNKLISKDNPDKVFDRFSMAAMIVGLGKSTMDNYQNELNYQLVNGRWYLSHATYNINWTMRREKQGITRPVMFKADFVVTDIEKENIVVPPEEELASKGILERQIVKNTDEFWKGFNYLKADNDFEKLFQEILNRD
ncbi:carboxypeptidase-like regulatory domain-containing protein [Ekhidna sp.]